MSRNRPHNWINPAPAGVSVVPDEPIKGPLPMIHVAFTMERVPGGWSLVKVVFTDDKIISIEKSEPDLKMVIIEKIKIQSVKHWNGIG